MTARCKLARGLFLGLILSMMLATTFGCGSDEDSPQPSPAATPDADLNIDQLRALGYVSFSDELVTPGESVVTGTKQALATQGFFLFTNRKPPSAQLIDQTGRVVHSWSHPQDRHWSNVEMLPNGDLLVPTMGSEGGGAGPDRRSLLRLAWDGREIWRSDIEAHHDMEVMATGDIAVLTYRSRRIPEVSAETDVLDISIVMLDAAGQVKREHSLYALLAANSEIFRFQRVAPATTKEGQEEKEQIDLLHANSIEIFPESPLAEVSSIYAPGNVLVSLRHQDTVAILSMAEQRIVWAWGQNQLSGPHDATLLSNGHILLFDNGLARNWSRVIELDPLERKIVWEYRATPPTSFYTRSRGSNQRLADGTTLITNSDNGEAFIATPDRDVIWRFVNPTAGPKGRRATMVRMKQVPSAWVEKLLAESNPAR